MARRTVLGGRCLEGREDAAHCLAGRLGHELVTHARSAQVRHERHPQAKAHHRPGGPNATEPTSRSGGVRLPSGDSQRYESGHYAQTNGGYASVMNHSKIVTRLNQRSPIVTVSNIPWG